MPKQWKPTEHWNPSSIYSWDIWLVKQGRFLAEMKWKEITQKGYAIPHIALINKLIKEVENETSRTLR